MEYMYFKKICINQSTTDKLLYKTLYEQNLNFNAWHLMTIKIENLEYLTLTSLTEHTTVQEIKAHILLSIILHP